MIVERQAYESVLGTWRQHEWQPASDDNLDGLVKCVWDFEGALAFRREQLFPNGLFELVVQLDEPHRHVLDGVAAAPFPAVCLNGLATQSSSIEGPRGSCRALGIRLHPQGALALMDFAPLAELTDRNLDFGTVAGCEADRLGQQLTEQHNGADRIRSAVGWLRRRLSRSRSVDVNVAALFAAIERDGGARSLMRQEALEGRSRSRLAARFREQIGLAPKRYARIVRFRRALELLDAEHSRFLTVAHAAGYYDQAHFNVEFREHAGLTPGEYRAARRFP
ncbi:MAG: helix-turn-helix transcriptional regulator, partial [Candidatus Eremiobacteraeota bacterium]|nr:helix-turn-helix transcriptional regulator [Candidatus Eremiobacteraeota bacterium]